jgi:hypothetical protein
MTITLIDLRAAGGAGQLIQHTQKLDAQPDLLIVRWSDGSISTVAFSRQPAGPSAATQP